MIRFYPISIYTSLFSVSHLEIFVLSKVVKMNSMRTMGSFSMIMRIVMRPLEFITRIMQKLRHFINQVEHPIWPNKQYIENNEDINHIFWEIQLNEEQNRVEPPQVFIINDEFDDRLRSRAE